MTTFTNTLTGTNDLLNRDFTDKDVKYRMQGTKYENYGSKRSGLASLKDSNIIKRHMQTEAENIGDECIRFSAIGKNGNPLPYATMNWNGRFITADDKGVFKIVDGDLLNERVKEEEERRKYIEDIIEKASLSDEVCRLMLGVDNAGLESIFGKGGTAPGINPPLDKDLRAVDAKPSMIACYDPTGALYARAIAKFKRIIMHYSPVIDNMTSSKVMNENV